MVKTTGEESYRCEACGMKYAAKEWAQMCEAWCTEHKSCNLDIIAHALPRDQV